MACRDPKDTTRLIERVSGLSFDEYSDRPSERISIDVLTIWAASCAFIRLCIWIGHQATEGKLKSLCENELAFHAGDSAGTT